MGDARGLGLDQLDKAKRGQLEKIDTVYKKEATEYYKEQRELVADQKRYSRLTFWSTIITGAATVVMAIFMALQYLIMKNDSEIKYETQLKLKQQSQLIDSLEKQLRNIEALRQHDPKENQMEKK
jgi:anti-sigma-K factor RskA